MCLLAVCTNVAIAFGTDAWILYVSGILGALGRNLSSIDSVGQINVVKGCVSSVFNHATFVQVFLASRVHCIYGDFSSSLR